MKRINGIYDRITDYENLVLAFYKAAKGKKGREDVMAFRRDFEPNINAIRQSLKEQNFAFGNYRFFTLYEPKKRTICAAPFNQRIVHHAIINLLDSMFENYQIYHSYACRKEKGTLKAVLQAFHFAKSQKYFLKMDIKKYFDSIDHAILKTLLRKKIKDKKLLFLLDNLIESYQTLPGKGLPIGNLTSQYFANYYLGQLDHYIKENLACKKYLRYMDDFVLFANDKKLLKNYLNLIEDFLKKSLALDLKIKQINTLKHGLPFLGFLIREKGIFLASKSKRRYKKKLLSLGRQFANADISESDYAVSLQSLTAFTLPARAGTFRKRVLKWICPTGSNRVKRGGNWNNSADNLRSANRNNNNPTNSNNNIGFRLCLSP